MSGIFSKKSNSQKTKAVSALQVQTSSYGPVLPLVYGKNRIAGNLGWYGNWKATGHKDSSSAGGKGGSSSGDTSYTYTTGVIIMLCEGQVQGIGTIWNDTATDTLSSLGMTFFNGATPQPAWSWLASYNAAQSLPYSGISYVAASALSLGDSTSLPNYNFEVAALVPFDAGTVDDALPTDILTDYLTDPHHGAGFGSYLADLTDLRNYCLARELFLSVIEDEQRTAADFLSDMATWCNFAPVWSFNQLKMIPYGDADLSSTYGSFTADVQPIYDLGADDFLYSDGSDAGVELDWKDIEDCHNSVRIEYNDRANSYNSVVQQAIDQADIDARGLYAMSDVQITCITDATTALHVAQLMLQRDLYIRKTYTFSTDMRYMLLEPMDVVTLTDPNAGLDRELVRITKVTEQNDSLQFEAEELPIGVATAAKNAPQTTSAFSQDTNVAPGNVSAPVIFNGPKALTASGYESWIAVTGLGTFWAGCDVYASSDGDTYDLVGRVTAPARYGALTAELPEGADPDTTNTMTAQLLTGQLVSGTQDDADSWNQFAFVDGAQGGEFVAFETATLQADGSYAMGYLRRGGYGTISQDHASGDSWVRIDNTILRVPYDYGKRGSTIYFKFCSFNSFGKATQSLAEVQAYPHVLGISSVPTLASLTASSDVVFGINVGWTFLPGTEFIRGTEIWYGTTNERDQATKLGEFPYPQAGTSLIGLAAGAELFFWGRLVDTTGSYSDWYPISGAVAGTASTDASAILAYLTGQITKSQLGKELLGDINDASSAANQALDAAEKNASDLQAQADELTQQQAGITSLQQSTSSLNTSITQLNTKVDGQSTSLTNLQQASDSQSSQLVTLNAQQSSNTSNITALQQAQASQASQYNALSSTVNGQTASIASLSATQANQAQTITTLSALSSPRMNLLSNPTFGAGWDGWVSGGSVSGFTLGIDPRWGHTLGMGGSFSGTFDLRSQNIAVMPNTYYYLSADMQCLAKSGVTTLIAEYLDENGAHVGWGDNFLQMPAGHDFDSSDQWRYKAQNKLSVPSGTSFLCIWAGWHNIVGGTWIGIRRVKLEPCPANATSASPYSDDQAEIQAVATATSLSATYSMRAQLTSDGQVYAAGMSLGVTEANGVVQSQFLVLANQFAVLSSTAGGKPTAVFVIENGTAILNSAIIGNATITSEKVSDLQSTEVTASGNPAWELLKNGTFKVWNDAGLNVIELGLLED